SGIAASATASTAASRAARSAPRSKPARSRGAATSPSSSCARSWSWNRATSARGRRAAGSSAERSAARRAAAHRAASWVPDHSRPVRYLPRRMAPARSPWNPALVALDCPACGAALDLSAPRMVCACGQPLVARYDLERVRRELTRDGLARFGSDLWRYRALLPFADDFAGVRLGEGGTPPLPAPGLAPDLGLAQLGITERAPNPTR